MSKEFAAALGELEIAETHSDHVVGREHEVDGRLRAAEAGLLSARCREARDVLAKMDVAWEALHEERDAYGSLVTQLEAAQRAVVMHDADLGRVATTLRILARQFEAEGARDFHVRLLRSAANDAAALVRAA